MKQKIEKIKWSKKANYEQWLNERKTIEGVGEAYTRIGASDSATILGLNKWKSKRRLFLHLVGAYSKFDISPRTLYGHLAEPLIAKYWSSYNHDEDIRLYNTQHGIVERKIKKADYFVTNSVYPNFFASQDYINVGKQYSPFTGEAYKVNTGHEFKTVDPFYYKMKDWETGITASYYCQCQHQMLVTNTDVVVFHVLTGSDYHVREVYRDQDFIDNMVSEVNNFVNQVNLAKIFYISAQLETDPLIKHNLQNQYEELLPENEELDDSVKLSNELHQPSIDKDADFIKIEEKDEAEGWMEEYTNLLVLESNIKGRKDKLQSDLIDFTSGFEGILSPNHKAIIRGNNSFKNKYFSVKKLNK